MDAVVVAFIATVVIAALVRYCGISNALAMKVLQLLHRVLTGAIVVKLLGFVLLLYKLISVHSNK